MRAMSPDLVLEERRVLSADTFQVAEIELRKPSLGGQERALTFVHLSDLHMRAWGTQHDRLLAIVNGRDLDFAFLTGDFLSRRPESLELTGRLAGRLRTRSGVFVCRGNWEVVCGPPLRRLRSRLSESGAELLVNESRMVTTSAGVVRVVGVDDLWRGAPDLAAACRADSQEVDFTVMLAHEPLAALLLPEGHGVDLALTGHTHGGQVRVPGVWRWFLPPAHGGFTEGLHELGGMRLYVSRGFGVGMPLPVRFRCPAEATLFRVRGDETA